MATAPGNDTVHTQCMGRHVKDIHACVLLGRPATTPYPCRHVCRRLPGPHLFLLLLLLRQALLPAAAAAAVTPAQPPGEGPPAAPLPLLKPNSSGTAAPAAMRCRVAMAMV